MIGLRSKLRGITPNEIKLQKLGMVKKITVDKNWSGSCEWNPKPESFHNKLPHEITHNYLRKLLRFASAGPVGGKVATALIGCASLYAVHKSDLEEPIKKGLKTAITTSSLADIWNHGTNLVAREDLTQKTMINVGGLDGSKIHWCLKELNPQRANTYLKWSQKIAQSKIIPSTIDYRFIIPTATLLGAAVWLHNVKKNNNAAK